MNAASDTLLVTQNFCTLAEAYGLGICYLGTTIYNPDRIIDILKLPKLVMPVATITIGYPDEEPVQVDRLPLEGILHEEIYADYTQEKIDAIYALKESLPENHQFIAENGKTTLAQVFTDVRYKKADNEYMSEILKKTLKKQGSSSDLNGLFTSIRSLTILQACKTVAWSRFPMSIPIFEADISVCFLAKYIAIWRTCTTSRLRVLE